MRRRIVRLGLSLALAFAVAGATTWAMGGFWSFIGGGEMSVHGWIALTLGVVGTAGLAWLLMALAFKSHREGWDDQVDNRFDPGRSASDDEDD